VLVIEDVSDERLDETAQQIRDWITRNKIAIVNIAGNLPSFQVVPSKWASWLKLVVV
jgi:hypothetical protein